MKEEGQFYETLLTRALVAVEPAGLLLETNVGTETAFRHDHCKHIKKSKHLWGQRSVDTVKLSYIFNYINLHAQCHGFWPKRNHFRVALNLDILDASWSPNAIRDHAGTAQVDFEVDRPPPADSPPGDLLITMVKETVILYKKSFEKWKKGNFFVPLIDLKVMKTLRVCLWLCQACKRGFIYVKKFSLGSTQLPTSRHLLSPS